MHESSLPIVDGVICEFFELLVGLSDDHGASFGVHLDDALVVALDLALFHGPTSHHHLYALVFGQDRVFRLAKQINEFQIYIFFLLIQKFMFILKFDKLPC